MSDIDFQIVDVENELEKRRNQEGDPNLAEGATNSGCGTAVCLIIGLPLLLLVAELFEFFL